MLRRTIQVLVMVLLGFHVVGCGGFRPPDNNALVGKEEAAVRRELGLPREEFAGYYGLPPLDWTKQFTGAIKTSVFQETGGAVFVSFEKRNGVWVVICNSWLPQGAVF